MKKHCKDPRANNLNLSRWLIWSFKDKCNAGAASVLRPDVAFLSSPIIIDVRGHLHPCDEETLKQKHVRSLEGGRWRHARLASAAACWGLQRNENTGQVHFTSKEAARHHHSSENTGSPSGPDTTTPLDASNAYRAGSVRAPCRKFLQKNNTWIIRFQNFLFYRKLWKVEVTWPTHPAALGKANWVILLSQLRMCRKKESKQLDFNLDWKK